MSWETTIRTGSYEGDQQALAQCDAQARSQGLSLRVTQLPGGGFHVAAVASMNPYEAAPPNPYNSAPPPAAYGNPYINAPAGVYGNPYASPAPSPYGGGYGAPAPSPYAHQENPHAGGSHCDQFGVQGPVKRATFMQNIGMLVIRFPRTRHGNMWRRCIDQYF